MMSNICIFTPGHEFACRSNYDDFIRFSKNELTLFDACKCNGQVGWECDKWSWVTPKGKKLTFVFGISNSHSSYTPYSQPYLDFAKAFIRYHQSINFRHSTHWASALPWLYQALKEYADLNSKTEVDFLDLNNDIINRTEEIIRTSGLSTGGKRNIGISLEKALEFTKEARFKLDLQEWKNPFPRPRDTAIRLDETSRKKNEKKCPSDYQILQVAEAFRRAETPHQRYFTSLCVMLMCQPSRSVELNGLTIYSLQRSESGRLYLMWHPAKGGDPVRKWIPRLLECVVEEAFNRLVEISAPARAAAKFAHDYPDRFMIHDACSTPSDFSQDKPLNYEQFANAMGLKTGLDSKGNQMSWATYGYIKWINRLISKLNGVSNWVSDLLQRRHVSPSNEILTWRTHLPTDVHIKFPSYKDLLTVIEQNYKSGGFPYYGGVPIYESLCLVRDYEFHKEFKVRPFSWIPVGHGMLADAIGSERENVSTSGKVLKAVSVFEEMSITDEDGSDIRLTTHQFRHWLNTKLMLSGEEDWLIARWSGRADIKQNKAYDGRTQEQKSRLTKRLGSAVRAENDLTIAEVSWELAQYTSESPPPPMVLHDLALPVSLKSLGAQRDGVAQFTGLGYCVHNYAESPCVKNGDCATCSEHVCLKGIPHTLDELKVLERLHEEQLGHARASAQDKVFGADRWVTSLGFKLTKLKTIIAMLENAELADGTPIRVPDEFDPSPVKRSLNIDETKISPTFDLTALAIKKLEH